MTNRPEMYEAIDSGLDAMVKDHATAAEAPRYLNFIDIRSFWDQLSPDTQADIGVAAIMMCYANHLRGDTSSEHDKLYEILEFQSNEILHEQVNHSGIYDRSGLPLDPGDDALYAEYLNEILTPVTN